MPNAESRESNSRSFWNFIAWGTVGSVGLLLVTIVFDWGRFEVPRELLQKIAEAGLIAMFLAITVDIYLKTELTKDAIKVAIGYVLPPYLQEEMAAIYSNEVICVDHNQIVTLSKLQNDLVRVTVRMERTLKNISTVSHLFDPKVLVDEWLVDNRPSTIREIGCKKNGEPEVTSRLDRINSYGRRNSKVYG